MARGLKVPVQVGPNGRTATVEGDEQASKIIRLALSDNDNDNAFQQDIGLGVSATFNIRSPGFRARVMSRLFRIFAVFEANKLYKLDRNSVVWRVATEGEQILEFKYLNMETDQPATFQQNYTSARRA